MIDVFINDILSTPAILISFFVLLGSVLLKKSLTEIVSGVLKTILGFTLLDLGAGIVAESLNNFSAMFMQAFHLRAVVINSDAFGAILTEKYTLAPFIFIMGMIINLVIAKFTHFKFIYLSGHLALYMSGMLAMILSGFHMILALFLGAVLLGLYMSFSPALLHKYTKKITGEESLAIANTGSITYFLAGKLGEWFGNPEKSTEDLKVPKGLGFLQDSAVSMSLTMSLLFFIVSLFSGSDFVESNLSNGQSYLFFAFMQGIIFSAGVQIVLVGINMGISEIIPAFRGIAEKLIEGAIPGLDAPFMMKYSPNSMILGFLVSLGAGIIGMVLLMFTNLPVIIPGMLQHFFIGGVSATYGNSTGGRRGAILGALVNGFLMTFFSSIFIAYVSNGTGTVVFGDVDFTIIGVLLKFLTNLF